MFEIPEALHSSGTLTEMFQNLRRFVCGDMPEDTPAPLKDVKQSAAYTTLNMCHPILTRISDYLEKLELGPVRFFGNGEHNLVFGTDGLLIKLNSSEAEGDNELSDMILRPIVRHDFDERMHSVSMEIVPRLNTKDVTLEHVNALGVALAKKGYVFWDNKVENVGLLPDGTPVVIDAGAVRKTPRDATEQGNFDFWKVMDPPTYVWEGKQEQYFSELRQSFSSRVDPDDLKPTRKKKPFKYEEYPAHWGM